MIFGGMGPSYVEPKSDGGKLFEGFYALYSGLLLIGVTGLIFAPINTTQCTCNHLPDTDAGSTGLPKRKPRSGSAKRGST
jgi:hypothetical protein